MKSEKWLHCLKWYVDLIETSLDSEDITIKIKNSWKLYGTPQNPEEQNQSLKKEQNLGHDTWQIKMSEETSTE